MSTQDDISDVRIIKRLLIFDSDIDFISAYAFGVCSGSCSITMRCFIGNNICC